MDIGVGGGNVSNGGGLPNSNDASFQSISASRGIDILEEMNSANVLTGKKYAEVDYYHSEPKNTTTMDDVLTFVNNFDKDSKTGYFVYKFYYDMNKRILTGLGSNYLSESNVEENIEMFSAFVEGDKLYYFIRSMGKTYNLYEGSDAGDKFDSMVMEGRITNIAYSPFTFEYGLLLKSMIGQLAGFSSSDSSYQPYTDYTLQSSGNDLFAKLWYTDNNGDLSGSQIFMFKENCLCQMVMARDNGNAFYVDQLMVTYPETLNLTKADITGYSVTNG